MIMDNKSFKSSLSFRMMYFNLWEWYCLLFVGSASTRELRSCQDAPDGWTDLEGSDCEAYATGAWCTQTGGYGAGWGGLGSVSFTDFANSEGIDAITACCVCGGGSTGVRCVDNTINGVAWHDSSGESFDCEWYKSDPSHCRSSGNDYKNDGLTANTACCACGGGSSGRGSSSPPTVVGSVCEDIHFDGIPWSDSGGKQYTCGWYENERNACNNYGASYRNFGLTASSACCTCGGGLKATTRAMTTATSTDLAKSNTTSSTRSSVSDTTTSSTTATIVTTTTTTTTAAATSSTTITTTAADAATAVATSTSTTTMNNNNTITTTNTAAASITASSATAISATSKLASTATITETTTTTTLATEELCVCSMLKNEPSLVCIASCYPNISSDLGVLMQFPTVSIEMQIKASVADGITRKSIATIIGTVLPLNISISTMSDTLTIRIPTYKGAGRATIALINEAAATLGLLADDIEASAEVIRPENCTAARCPVVVCLTTEQEGPIPDDECCSACESDTARVNRLKTEDYLIELMQFEVDNANWLSEAREFSEDIDSYMREAREWDECAKNTTCP